MIVVINGDNGSRGKDITEPIWMRISCLLCSAFLPATVKVVRRSGI